MSFFDRYVNVSEASDRYGNKRTVREFNTAKFSIHAAILLVAFIVLMSILSSLNPFNSVPTGSRGVVTQFGKIVGVEPEGLTILPPWQKLYNFSIRAETATVTNAPGATVDTQEVHTSMVVRYNIDPNKVSTVFEKYSHTGDLSSYVQSGVQEVFKAVTARYTAVDLVGKRAQVSSDIKDALQKKLDTYGAIVVNIDMTDFKFSDSYMTAINDKVTQEQKRLAAENRAKTAEAKQRIKVVTAEADANAMKARADGEAYATLTAAKAQADSKRLTAQAEADALKAQNASLQQSKDVLELRRIQVQQSFAEKWDGALPAINMAGGSGAMPFMDMTGVLNRVVAAKKGDESK